MPRLPSCQGFETPKPLTINVTHGDGDIVEVLSDVLALTKVNYNACDFPSALPVTFKFADRVGEILMASPRPITAPPLSSALSRLGGTAGYLRKRTADYSSRCQFPTVRIVPLAAIQLRQVTSAFGQSKKGLP